MKKFFGEFKTFALRGNVIDLAVGVIIGGAFQKIVTSVVNDLIMPWIGLLTGGTNFADQFTVLKLPEGVTAEMVTSLEVAKELGVTTFNYGAFITAVIDFIIMAFIIFLLVKGINKLSTLKKAEEEVPAEPTTKICPFCKSEIAIEATRCAHCTSELPNE
ncbi:MAG: large conductance mechanosensitive channel protein MscL [Ruminococcaceae bacterium]|nr:large conductance mechanosensitive channel protein MscL [Oscillospiraceae bacterium]